jgi:hypothetical protein
MSAPPIGMMMSTPSTKASTAITMYGVQAGAAPSEKQNTRPSATMAIATSRLIRCWPG